MDAFHYVSVPPDLADLLHTDCPAEGPWVLKEENVCDVQGQCILRRQHFFNLHALHTREKLRNQTSKLEPRTLTISLVSAAAVGFHYHDNPTWPARIQPLESGIDRWFPSSKPPFSSGISQLAMFEIPFRVSLLKSLQFQLRDPKSRRYQGPISLN